MFKKNNIPWNKDIYGYKTQPASEERKRKIGLAHKGKTVSAETREKISLARIGKIPWNKGTKGIMKGQEGSKNPNYKGGSFKDKEGYFLTKNKTHPFCNAKGYVRRPRLVMEKKIGRYLKPEERVHHINGIKDDDRPENLQLFINNNEHIRFHNLSNPKTKHLYSSDNRLR